MYLYKIQIIIYFLKLPNLSYLIMEKLEIKDVWTIIKLIVIIIVNFAIFIVDKSPSIHCE